MLHEKKFKQAFFCQLYFFIHLLTCTAVKIETFNLLAKIRIIFINATQKIENFKGKNITQHNTVQLKRFFLAVIN